ncbi:dihydrodipicolinate synthase family protein [Jidongwangia harbinensis]|uniref:dihydrodipicolinate synthase family protein n=1 Tax=Jidongwangia harbinensis TaxID=2878561 RepID=UPI001CD92AD1|nr:dihydrodipicolinate synthase family protein [Jidongwangia harbinensis]MCA2216213.1 dihydrodipicolinate synthase family protein [Jidongwangia harbinensis]
MGDVRWTGPAVALVTMFDDGGAVLARETAAHAARLVAAGMRAVVVAGSTGEAAALTDAERAEVVAAVREACPDVPVVAGSSGDWWRQAADRTEAVVKAGADAVLVAPPRLGGALDVYYGRVAEAAGTAPVLAYHYPGVAGGEVPVAALTGLPLAGLKDSSGIPARLAAEIDLEWPGAVYTGSAALTGYARWLGATGAILAVANVAPELSLAAWDGDAGAQRELIRTEQSYKAGPGLKAALADRYGTPPTRRLG